MSFFKNLFGKKEEKPIQNYDDFWKWFQSHAKEFFNVVKAHEDTDENFFSKLAPKLAELRNGYFFLAGMIDDDTADLVLTADGNINNIVFVEELVAAAPPIEGWTITCLKPPMDGNDFSISMNDFDFSTENMFFYSIDHEAYPDEVDIVVIHEDYNDENKATIEHGIYIFLDNFLGELEFAQSIDNLSFIEKSKAEKKLVPLEKLKNFLKWRQKEFIEKYEGTRFQTEDDNYAAFQGSVKNGNPLLAIMNSALLKWDSKASHPWVAILEFKYNSEENNGMPEEADYQLLNTIEEGIMEELKDSDGYLNVGRQTADGAREIYFACKDFRKPSKVFHKIEKKYANQFEISIDIYKDKYWQSFRRFGV